MKKSRLFGVVCVCAVGIVTSQTAWASLVTITNNNGRITASADNLGTTTGYTAIIPGYTIPISFTRSAYQGNSSGTASLNYSGNNITNATFAYDFSYSIDNTIGETSYYDGVQSFNYLYFTPDSNATYSIDGYFEMTGQIGTGTILSVYLQDVTTGYTYLFQDNTASSSTTHAYFEAGVANDGDANNATYGSLTGELIAGHDYLFYYGASIQNYDFSERTMVAATAEGAVNFRVSTVPIPATVWLFGAGLVGLLGIASRRKTA